MREAMAFAGGRYLHGSASHVGFGAENASHQSRQGQVDIKGLPMQAIALAGISIASSSASVACSTLAPGREET